MAGVFDNAELESIKTTLLALLDISADEDVVEKTAEAYQKHYIALIRHGFTNDQALQIVLKMNMNGSQK